MSLLLKKTKRLWMTKKRTKNLRKKNLRTKNHSKVSDVLKDVIYIISLAQEKKKAAPEKTTDDDIQVVEQVQSEYIVY